MANKTMVPDEILRDCPSCGVAPGSYHKLGCSIEACRHCGGQLIDCTRRLDNSEDSKAWWPPLDEREVFTGRLPGTKQSHEQLMQAFRAMRERGLIAKRNFCCSWTCGVEAMYELAEQRLEKGKEAAGYVFYDWEDNEHRRWGNFFFITFGVFDWTEAENGISEVEVGNIVCECLRDQAIYCDWSGNPEDTIRVSTSSIRRALVV
jgi:DNA-binding transcriptional ArsR family regulator